MLKQLLNISKKYLMHKSVISFILILSITFGGYQAYAEGINTVKVCINGDWTVFRTNQETVGDFLNSQDIVLHEKDIINVELDDEVTNNFRIVIKKAVTVNFNISSEENIEFVTNALNIGKAINELSEETGVSYKLADGQSSSSKLVDGMDIYLLAYTEEYKTIETEISYSTETVENNQVLEGTQTVKTAGVNGIKETVVKEVYLDGELISSEIISENVALEPVNEVIEVGTKPALNTISTEKGTFVVSKELTMKSSAYTSSVECTGKNPGDAGYGITASGMKAQYGVVAVDPSVIPLGTKLYIEGYGYAIAGDTGGSIKGNKVDLYFNTYSEAINYGVKQVKVYVLGEQV